MESNILKFKCTGMEDGGKISVENNPEKKINQVHSYSPFKSYILAH